MNLLAPIKSIMTTDIVSIAKNDPVKKVEEIFNEYKFHHIPVVESGKIVGMVSKSDYQFFKRGFNDDRSDLRIDSFRLRTHKVKEIMTTGLATLEPDDKINIALEIFKENLFHAIPITENEKLVGIVSTLDIIKHLADDVETVKKYEL
jgi:acetoin utilization protein AcuB